MAGTVSMTRAITFSLAALAQCKRFFSRRPLRRKGKNKKKHRIRRGFEP
jgi:hypothetical protein